MSNFVKVAQMKDIPDGEIIQAEFKGETVCISNIGGKVFAIGNSCTHRGAPLSDGQIEDNVVVCPWHGAKFDLKTGEKVGASAGHVPCFDVQINGDDINLRDK